MTPDTALLERILWSQVERPLQGRLPEWRPDSDAARAIRGVLVAPDLAAEEEAIVARWDGALESSKKLFDRLLQARVNRAVKEGLRVAAEELDLSELPLAPRVLIVREGEGPGLTHENGARTAGAANVHNSVVEFLSDAGQDVAGLEPGAKLDQLVDLLVLANQDGAESLRATLGSGATITRLEDGPQVDLLLAAHSPSIQVFDIERELARLEEILRNAIPAERRPAKSGAWSFGHDLTGELLGGKYRIRGLKGKGAFKTVYEGEDEMLGARVAVAVLNPKGAGSPRALEHFQDEAKKLTTLDHENIVRWITFDRTAEGLHYFVMEFLDGEELEKVLRREGRLAPKRVAAILLQVLGALRRAHAKGKHGSLLHLDLKPENVFLLPLLAPGEPERVKVIDFGIGQHVGAEVRAAENPELRSLYDLPTEELGKSIGSLMLPEDDDLPEDLEVEREEAESAAGRVRRRVQRARGGTLLYASPEQCKHLAGHKDIEPLDGRSDLYSLGVMAFRMLTGQFPFARITTAYEAIQNHLEAAPRKVGTLGIKLPRELAAFVDRCLVKEREKRWKDAGEAYAALERIVHPRLSPVKVAVPIALAGALGLGALYLTREPVVNALTLVDLGIESQSGRVMNELFLGPKNPSRLVTLESDVAWGDGAAPTPRLLDATSGQPLAGWSARWPAAPGTGGAPLALEIACLPEARSAAAVLELEEASGGLLGRRSRWRSGRLALSHLGAWRIERVTVPGHEPAKLLDPRGRSLELELAGDPEGRAALESIEVLHDGARIGRTSVTSAREGHALYAGPALDALFTGETRPVELLIVGRDRAGQEEETTVSLRIAGGPAELGPATGFVAKGESGSALLPFPGETQVLLPENALRVQATSPARARIFLETASTPAFSAEMPDPATPRLVTLAELGIAGTSELPGTLRLELDDAPWVDRATPALRTLRLPFRFTPIAPSIQVQLVAPGLERELSEQSPAESAADRSGASVDHVHPGEAPRLVVRTPPGTNLWIEASCAREGVADAPAARMSRTSGPFELPLELGDESVYRLVVRKYLLLAGDERGPLIPPEHAFRIEVDRTAPTLELALEGVSAVREKVGETGEPFYCEGQGHAGFSQRIVARLHENSALASLRWTLTLPDGSRREGTLEPAAVAADGSLELPSLRVHQEAEGHYALELVVSDLAGNTGRASSAWQVARSGPALALREPLVSGEGRRWALGSGRAFDVRVRASDANGVAAVRVRLVYQDQPGPELELRPAAGELWELGESVRPSAHPWWAQKELVLELVAVDRAGLETRKTERGVVPDLPRTSALVIAPRAGVSAGAMVEIAASEDYVFGGRSGEGRRPWNVVLPRGALRSFYLDAREVSRAEFLEFLRSEAGYADRRWWPEGAAPEAARAAELASALAGEPERTATGIAWAEAHAYAAWRGKRLPTLLEWEFAVRGPEYRETPGDARPPGAPADWPANLTTGAPEWTATPERLVADALDFPSQCRRYPERLLPPPSGPAEPGSAGNSLAAGSHWVAGARTDEVPSWSSRTVRKDAGDGDVGFRCILERETAHGLLDRGDYAIVE